MSVQAVLLPVFVQAGLTFALLLWMGMARVSALRAGEARIGETALREPAWPKRVQQVGNACHNQFETPILFYAVVAFAMITRQADFIFVLLSWLFVAFRLVHVFIHTTSNVVRLRFSAFLAGASVLTILWVHFAVKIFSAPMA